MGCGGPSGPTAPSIGTVKSSTKQPNESKSDKADDLRPVTPVSEDGAFDLAAADAASDPAAADVRYFSLAFLQSNGISSENLETLRKATTKLMNSLSWQPSLGLVTAIDPGNAVLKIRLSEFGWTKATWDTLVASHPDAGTGVPGLQVLKQRTGSQKPMIRAEWFVRNASSPPLYYQLGNAPENAAKLAARLGISFDADISAGRVKRAGFSKSLVSTNHRVIEYHKNRNGFLWRSFEFGAKTGNRNIFAFPLGPGAGANSNVLASILGGNAGSGGSAPMPFPGLAFVSDGSEYLFTLPNGMIGFFITGATGVRINEVPGNAQGKVIAGVSCMRCHSQGTKPATDQVRSNARLSGDALAWVQKLYVEAPVLDAQLAQDRQLYLESLKKLGIPEDESDPVNASIGLNLK